MGGFAFVFGEVPPAELRGRLEELPPADFRGRGRTLLAPPLALRLDEAADGALDEGDGVVVALHGWLSDGLPPAATTAEGLRRAWIERGEAAISDLRGEFTAAVYSRRDGLLRLARDLAGTRPLFLRRDGPLLLGATDVRGLDRRGISAFSIDEEAFALWRAGTPHPEKTCYAGVRRSPAGRVVSWRAVPDGAVVDSDTSLWDAPAERDPRETTFEEDAEELRGLLARAVERAARGASPTVTLSGGLDSSAVWALAHRAAGALAVSLRYPGLDCDEGPEIASVLAACPGEAREIPLGPVTIGQIRTTTREVDLPHLPTLGHSMVLAGDARAAGRRIVLTGVGGDDLFAGTRAVASDLLLRGRLAALLRLLRRLRGRHGAGALALLRSALLGPLSRRPLFGHHRASLEADLAALRAGAALEALEQAGALRGVEWRHPFLDADVAAFAFAAAGCRHVEQGLPKSLLRGALGGLLPDAVLARPAKVTFDSAVETVAPDDPRLAGALARLRGLDPGADAGRAAAPSPFEIADALFLDSRTSPGRPDGQAC